MDDSQTKGVNNLPDTACNLSLRIPMASGRLSAIPSVLCISEILDNILNAVGERAVLAHMAQCCKLFLQPALDVLWHDIPSLVPLVRLIPGPHEPCSPDWSRFDWYSPRVRIICDEHYESYYLFARLRPGVCPLPSLRSLELQMSPDRPKSLLFPPRLQSLSFCGCEPPYSGALEGYLSDAVQQVPTLKDLYVSGELTMAPALISHLLTFKHLRVLFLANVYLSDDPDDQIVQALIQGMSRMESLIEVGFPMMATEYTIPSSPTSFQNLQKLTLVAHPNIASAFLDNISTRTLHIVDVSSLVADSLSEWRDFFYKLINRHGASVCSITLSPTSRRADISLMSVLDPLLNLRNLQKLHFTNYPLVSLSLTPQDILQLASAWPVLREFHLDVDVRAVLEDGAPAGPSESTFLSLVTFARYCPHLSSLTLCITGEDIPDMCTMPRGNHDLKDLCLYLPDINDPTLVAGIVARLFPALFYIEVIPACGELKGDVVLPLIRSFQEEQWRGPSP